MDTTDYKIMVIDDNKELAEMIRDILKRSGYKQIVTGGTVKDGLLLFKKESPHMAILDIMLPDGDGYTLFQKIRAISPIPILFLSAKDEDEDRLFGLGLGADDYITKPFLPKELVLRVSAILKRTYQPFKAAKEPQTVLQLGNREIFFDNAMVRFEGKEVFLTAKEWILLKKLYQNRGKIVTFDALCYEAWGDSYYGYENTLMVHIRHLREKIEEDPSHPKWLVTARGLGYRLMDENKGKS